jgi:hypothetical protein
MRTITIRIPEFSRRALRVAFLEWLAKRAKKVLRWCWEKHPALRPAYMRGPFAQDVQDLPGGQIRDYSRRLMPLEGWPAEEEGDPLEDMPGCAAHGVEMCRLCVKRPVVETNPNKVSPKRLKRGRRVRR